MPTFFVTIEVGDLNGQNYESLEALVDTGATLSSVPKDTLLGLGLTPIRRGTFRLASGERVEMDMCETRVKVLGGETTTWILFGEEGSTPLLGALTLESLLLGVDPFNQRLVQVDGMLMAGLHQV